jgi:hypothetical protein
VTRWFKDPLYIKWRKEVYKRDKHTCQWPGCTIKKRLNAHHIVRWADNPALRFVTENGITLCYLHHKMVTGLESIYAAVFLKIIAEKKNERRL